MTNRKRKLTEINLSNCFSQQLKEKNCLCSEIINTSEIGIIIFKEKTNEVIFWNKNAKKITSEISDLTNNKSFLEMLQQANSQKATSRYLRKNGKIVELNVYGTKNYKWVFLKDISEQVKLQAIAQEMNYIENLSTIFSSIRHEIANPLITAKITLSVLKKKLNSLDKKGKLKYLERIEDSIERIEKLVSSLKSFNLFDNIDLEYIELNNFLQKEIELLLPYLEENNISLKLNLHKQPLILQANTGAMRQILLNIIFNAIDALKKNKNPEIIITSTKKDKNIILTISNNGEKIPENTISKIFDPFFTTKNKGTGLGLAIVKKFMSIMNGTVDVQSTNDKTVFVLTFLPKE